MTNNEQFIADMQRFDRFAVVRDYSGRGMCGARCAAVECGMHSQIDTIKAATKVKLTWDNMGLGFIVYPISPDGDYHDS